MRAKFVNPGVPFLQHMPGGFPIGSILEIQGMMDSDAEKFTVDLHYNKGIAFHLNPRFDQNHVVRNSYLDGTWGTEETSGGMPIQKGKPFMMKIKAESTKYSIMFNDVEVFTYNYRFDKLDHIDKVEVHGNVNLTYVQF